MFFVRCLIPVIFKKDPSKPPEYRVVLANTSFVTVNSASHPDRTFSAHVQLVAPHPPLSPSSVLGYARWWRWQLGGDN